ncbi:urease accessory protein UreF [Streptomyces sp. P6-2-1]|uniref:urease accessory protein UreF n=1 Tax=Streptomyces sp. P6-2-1 TaxID=3422591 RepID=UPI003D36E1B0
MYQDEAAAPDATPVPGAAPGSTDVGRLLVSLQLTDSAFPSGFYTLSHSLEGFTQAKAVDRDSLPALLHDLLRHGVGPSDATALALAHQAAARADWAAVAAVDRRLHATKLTEEMRRAATRTGRQLLDLAAEVFDAGLLAPYREAVAARRAPGTQAVTVGVVNAMTEVPVRQAVVADLFAFCASFAGAALRLRLTDHRQAQVLLRHSAEVIEETASLALTRSLDDLGATTFAADIMSARHERAEARLFAS